MLFFVLLEPYIYKVKYYHPRIHFCFNSMYYVSFISDVFEVYIFAKYYFSHVEYYQINLSNEKLEINTEIIFIAQN